MEITLRETPRAGLYHIYIDGYLLISINDEDIIDELNIHQHREKYFEIINIGFRCPYPHSPQAYTRQQVNDIESWLNSITIMEILSND